MKVNEDLVRRTAARVRQEAKHGGWAQAEVLSPCGTKACFAGWALIESGMYEVEVRGPVPWFHSAKSGERMWQSAMGTAQTLLGLDAAQSAMIFLDLAADGDVEQYLSRVSAVTGVEGL